MVALDRQERGKGDKSAIQEVEEEYSVPVLSVVNLTQLIDYIEEISQSDKNWLPHLERIRDYRTEFGVE